MIQRKEGKEQQRWDQKGIHPLSLAHLYQGLPGFAFRVRIRTLSGRETRNAIISRSDYFAFRSRVPTFYIGSPLISGFARKREIHFAFRPGTASGRVRNRNAKRETQLFAFRSRGLNLT